MLSARNQREQEPPRHGIANHFAEILVAHRVVAVGQGVQPVGAQTLCGRAEESVVVRAAYDVAQVVHRELCYAAVECGAVGFGYDELLEVYKCALSVGEVAVMAVVGAVGGVAVAAAVGFGVGGVEAFRPQEQLRRELLVLVGIAGGEPQFAENGPLEDVAVGRSAYVVAAHVFASRHGPFVGERSLYAAVFGSGLEEHDVGVVVACYVEAVLVWRAYEQSVALGKLDEASVCHFESRVACGRQSAVPQPYVYDFVSQFVDFVQRCHVRTVVNDDYLAFFPAQRQSRDALDAFAQQRGVGVADGYDEAYQWLCVHKVIVYFFFVQK